MKSKENGYAKSKGTAISERPHAGFGMAFSPHSAPLLEVIARSTAVRRGDLGAAALAAVNPALLDKAGGCGTRRTSSTKSNVDFKPLLCHQERSRGSTVLARNPAVGEPRRAPCMVCFGVI